MSRWTSLAFRPVWSQNVQKGVNSLGHVVLGACPGQADLDMEHMSAWEPFEKPMGMYENSV